MTLTQNITLDVARETALHIAGKQFDENSRFLLVTIKEAGEEKSIPAGSTITLNARRPDGSAQSFAGSIQDGKAFVEIDQWILEQYGTVYCSISVVDSVAAKLTTLSFRLLVERAEGSGFVLVYVAAANLPAGTYYITMAGVNYSFTTTQAVPAGGKIYFSSVGTTGKTTNNGATIEDLTLTAGSTGTELQGSDIVNFLTQMQANVAAIDGELDSKADKSAIEENLTAGTSLATIDKDSYTPHNTPYLYRISPSGKRCEYDVIGGTVGWNQLVNPSWIVDGLVGVTATIDGFHITASGTTTQSCNVYLSQRNNSQMKLVSGHKYAMWGLGKHDNCLVAFYSRGGISLNIDTSLASLVKETIFSATFTDNTSLYLNVSGSKAIDIDCTPQLVDLTTLLGSTIADYAYTLEQATAGSGIAWLKSFGFLTKSYYPYCEPTLESVQATARVAVGINQWDEEWELGAYNPDGSKTTQTDRIRCKNPIPIIGNQQYYLKVPTTSSLVFVVYLDGNGNGIETSIRTYVPNSIITTPTNAAYMVFYLAAAYGTTYNGDICINLSNPTINGTYYPYESHTYPLGNTTLRGIPKLDSNNNIYYDGDKYKASGEITRRYIEQTYDGTEAWIGSANGNGIYRFNRALSQRASGASVTNIMKSNILTPSNYAYASASTYNGTISFDSSFTTIYIIPPTEITTVDAFKAWLASHPITIVYEVFTPTTESADSFTPIQYTGSTEAFTTSNDVPVGVEGKYYTDLTLPKLPTTNGTYTLKCTVTDGTGIVSWVSE